ncbi:uncharacterized protein YecA (UPF0149 family) [Dysgonomonadaceae bacterium PH5-43]|nr:uncharacterized protein YecA (UPF0149 family) [Dysgonomonadaceae bacterium PH5-43]
MKKKIMLLLLLAFPLFVSAQNYDEVPVKNGKIVFSEDILTALKTVEMKETVLSWLEETFLPNRGLVVNIDTVENRIICRVMERLEIEKRNWSQFVLNMRYTLVLEFKTNKCFVSVNNISYVEPAEMQSNPDNIGVYSAESVLIDKKYKEVSVEEPIKKIQKATIDNIEDLFFDIRELL